MGTRPLFSPLSPGDGAAILVADFQPLTAAPRLSRLVADAAAGHPVYQVDPRGALSGDRRFAALPELAEETADLFRAAAAPDRPVFVVGHCSAAALTLRIAGALAGEREVTAILVQPTWPGTDHVTERFAEFQGKLGLGDLPCPDLDGDPGSCIAEMEQLMSEGLAGLAARLGLSKPPLAFSELLVSYRSWLAFLLACRNDRPVPVPPGEVAISVLTDEPGFVLPGSAPGRCRITPPPPADRPDAVTPELAKHVLDRVHGH
ncbi:alpha/beta fold hydrolase [Amycolatopsis australiensis]|uniref:alpha/beta fold hydrolase n=1 Tax=Amycolatopsis australiensis TaxID=546364 RepID=UPI001160FFE8|nr:alpha/beta fold hydrolase [Amycolatopsis australiensis]